MDEISIEKARAKLGDIVHAAETGSATRITRHGRPVAMVVSVAPRITAQERHLIDLARNLEALGTISALRAETGADNTSDGTITALAHFWGAARVCLADLLVIVDRLVAITDSAEDWFELNINQLDGPRGT